MPLSHKIDYHVLNSEGKSRGFLRDRQITSYEFSHSLAPKRPLPTREREPVLPPLTGLWVTFPRKSGHRVMRISGLPAPG